jgi:hypothetical protein
VITGRKQELLFEKRSKNFYPLARAARRRATWEAKVF